MPDAALNMEPTDQKTHVVPPVEEPEEMPLPSEMGGEGKPKEEEKPKPAGAANTSSAAKAILEKYMRRPR